MTLYLYPVSSHPAFVEFILSSQANNCLTKELIALPSALPANCFVAVPITLPISLALVAPTAAIMALISCSSSYAESCLGR